jgi:hypothetical protein
MTATNFNRTIARAMFLPWLIVSMLLVGCFKPPQAQTSVPISISLTSNPNAPLGPSQSTVITAAVYDLTKQGVTWTISPLHYGSLTQASSTAVTYTAPADVAVNQSVTITATSISNPTITASLIVATSPFSVVLLSSNSLPMPPQTTAPGQPLSISAVVKNDLSNQGVTWAVSPPNGAGTLVGSTSIMTTYMPPPTVSSPTNVTVTATAVVSSSAIATLPVTVLPSGGGQNVALIQVNGGPVPGQVSRNGAFTSLVICNPGTTTCQTLDGILVDTGSYGLRILQSEIPLLKLRTYADVNGNTLENCALQPDGSYLWGPVSAADVYLAGDEVASGANVQVISSSNEPVPDGCANGSTQSKNTPELLGANGILGIGPEPTDCTLSGVNYCDGSNQAAIDNKYYACLNGGCPLDASPVVVPATQQVTNPVILFTDNNGVSLQLPAVSGPTASVIGTMTFGVNLVGHATVYTLDADDHFATVFNGQTITDSFLDSGASALLFPDTLALCKINSTLFCPPSELNLTATIKGATQGESAINFSVGNADDLFSSNSNDSVFDDLAGPTLCTGGTGSCVFRWGLPFFYGRTVFTVIDKQAAPANTPKPPWWAF